MDNDTQNNFDAIIGRMDKITDQRAMIIQKATEYKMEEERKEERKKEERIIKLASECTEMLEKAMLNIDYESLVCFKYSPINLNLIGKSFTENLTDARLKIDEVYNRAIITLYYKERFPNWTFKDDYSNLFEELYQIFIKRYPERDNIPCIRIIKSITSNNALNVIFSKEPVKKEYTKTLTK